MGEPSDIQEENENEEISQTEKLNYKIEYALVPARRKRDIIKDKIYRKSYAPTSTPPYNMLEENQNNDNLKEVYEIVAKVEEGLMYYQNNFPKLDGFPSQFLPSFVSLRQSVNTTPNNRNSRILSNNNNNDADEFIIIKDSHKREIIYSCITEFIKILSNKHQLSYIAIRFLFNCNEFDQIQTAITNYVSQFQKVHLLYFQIQKELKQLIQHLEIEINATVEEYHTKALLYHSNANHCATVNCSAKVLELARSTEKSFLILQQWDHSFHSLFDKSKALMERSLSRFPPY